MGFNREENYANIEEKSKCSMIKSGGEIIKEQGIRYVMVGICLLNP